MIIRKEHIIADCLKKIEVKKELKAKGECFSSGCPTHYIKGIYMNIVSKEFNGCAKQDYKKNIYHNECQCCWAYFLDHYIEKKSNTEGFIDV